MRGVALEPPLDRPTVTRLGVALATHLGVQSRPRRILVAGDTRASTPVLAAWLAAGFLDAGGEVVWGNVLPTPAVSRLLRDMEGFGAGVVVSASHNPARDNGIKLVTAAGTKWPAAEERLLEERLRAAPPAESQEGLPPPEPGLRERYVSLLAGTLPQRCLVGLRLVVDAAHGAASAIAAPFFTALGADVELLFAAPDGGNINAGCGTLHPQTLAAQVRERSGHAGVAFDGDADRTVLVTHTGRVLDGDDALLLWGRALARDNLLPGNALVATVMSNLGLEVALRSQGLGLVRCPVGDREVWEAMQREGLALGGEQSGHIICSHLSVSGDGLLTAAHILAEAAQAGRPLEELADMEHFPQVLVNLRVQRRKPIESVPALAALIEEIQRRLKGSGRLLVRYSGTEPLLRIMVEARTQEDARNAAEDVMAEAREHLGAVG